MKLNKIVEVALYVNDIKKAEEFYVGVLGLDVVKRSSSTPDRDLFLSCGDTMLLLFNPELTKIDGGVVPTHGSIGEGHMAFAVPEADFEKWEDHFTQNEISVEKKANWEKGTKSLYFRDPSGNSLEFISNTHWF